jgi:hypothetical protein
MSSTDQQYIDHLYNQIFVQQLRCDHFNTITPQPSTKSVWNKSNDEEQILDLMVQKYKEYYQNKATELKNKVEELKETNVTHFLTYDTDYYINEYTQRTEQIDNYLVELAAKTVDHIAKETLGSVSEEIDVLFPGYMADPTLVGKLC